MLPICLVTGFLGTGKTTFLRTISARNHHRKLVYLVNEFSAHDVDGALVSEDNPNVISIPGGSIFCRCLVTEFIAQLRRVASDWGDADGVVIEASGMANPGVIETMLNETGLDASFRIATILCVVDPNSFLKLRHTLPNILAQVAAADVVLINKTDRNPREKIAETLALLREIQPAAERIETVRCEADVDLFAERTPRGLRGEYAKCRDPNFTAFVTHDPLNGDRLERFVEDHAEEIYRVKGTLRNEFFDYSATGTERRPKPGAIPALAWIVRGGCETDIRNGARAAAGPVRSCRRVDVSDILDLRFRVLISGTGRTTAEFDGDRDPATRHYGIFEDGQLCGCASFMRSEWEGRPVWQLRGMAVEPDVRNRGLGADVLRFAEADLADDPSVTGSWCNARIRAVPFYERLGWKRVSEEFDIAGVGPHVRMVRG